MSSADLHAPVFSTTAEIDEDNRFELDSVSDDEQDVADLGKTVWQICWLHVAVVPMCHHHFMPLTSLFLLNGGHIGLESAHGSKTALGQGYGSGNSSRTVTHQGGDDPQHPHASEGNMVSGGIKRVLQGAADVTLGVVDRAGAVVDTAAGLVTTAAVGVASKTPVLKGIVTVYVHRLVVVMIMAMVMRPVLEVGYVSHQKGLSFGRLFLTFSSSSALPLVNSQVHSPVIILTNTLYLCPILSRSGFWEAYEHVRDFIHAILRRELVRNPTTVYFTGHSLGKLMIALQYVNSAVVWCTDCEFHNFCSG